MSHPHGCVSWNYCLWVLTICYYVTPSRVCELKSDIFSLCRTYAASHPHGCVSWNPLHDINYLLPYSHTLTGVWVEILNQQRILNQNQRHTLTGVWVEILSGGFHSIAHTSHPHGCVSWNLPKSFGYAEICHTLTGVWVEIIGYHLRYASFNQSHPHGCVSWNLTKFSLFSIIFQSHPHGCVSWNFTLAIFTIPREVTPSRVCELKFLVVIDILLSISVTPSRVCELKSN